MSTLLDTLEPLWTDIADLIGEVAGNEAYIAVLDAQCNPHDDPPRHSRMLVAKFDVPGTYGFTLEHPYWGDDMSQESGTVPAETQQALAQAASNAWHQAAKGYSAAQGSDAVMRTWSQNVWEPDVEAMTSSVKGLASTAGWLHDQLGVDAGWVGPGEKGAPAWLTQLAKNWPTTSASSEAFFAFWTDVNDKCALYLDAAQRLAAAGAQATGTVNDFQTNLWEVTLKTRDHVVVVLQQWQKWQGPRGTWPTGEFDDTETQKAILGGVSYVSGIVGFFPPASIVAGVVGLVTGTLQYLVSDKVTVMKAATAATANELWMGHYDDIATVVANLKTALDGVQTTPQQSPLASTAQGFQQYVDMVEASHQDWSPPEVRL